ncbi:MAG: metallophosphoesterase, partial [Clostridia bacterium]|nr:metallophosphoesterase [Clostridia bacterium]
LIALVLSVSLLFGVASTSVSADEALADDTSTTVVAEDTTVAEDDTTAPSEEETTVPDDSAEPEEPAVIGDTTPFRISVVVYGRNAQKGITWYTKTKTKRVVELNPANAKVEYAEVFEWEGNYVHKATVTGLAAGAEYAFRVGNGTEFSAWGKFVTDNGDSKVDFITFADVQAGNQENFNRGARVVEQAFKTMPTAEFMACLGDFTDDSTNEEWDWYDSSMREINMNSTLVPVAGNHDGLGVENWFNNMFNLDTTESVETSDGVNYSFDYGNIHFAVVNTNDMLSISLSQLIWLKNDMNSTDKDWKIVLMHKSPYSLGKDAKWPDALYLQRSLATVVDECGVDLVLSGHDHQYIRTKPLKSNKVNEDGTVYILSGTAGAKRYEVRPFLENHFLKTDFIAAGTIQRSGGDYFDGDWDQENPDYEGGIFSTFSVDGGVLTVHSYVVSDYTTDENGNIIDVNEEPKVTRHDSFTIVKETGKNEITFTGDNTTSEAEYILGAVPSFMGLAAYTFIEWLPKFLIMVPELLYSVIVLDIF